MPVEVMQYYGLTQALSQAGYYETEHHQQLIKDIKSAVMQGRLIAVCRVVGSGKMVTLRRLQQIPEEEIACPSPNRIRWRSTASSWPH